MKLESNEKPERGVLATLTFSHLAQHFYAGLSVLYTDIMFDLKLNYIQLGVMTGTTRIISGFLQIVWSILSRYFSRRFLLGFGNILTSIGCLIMGRSQRFIEITSGNVVSGSGQAAPHPIGTSIIASKFQKSKIAGALSIFYGLGYIGNIISPIILSTISLAIGWRQAI
ncbi:MAG: MFS transporter, partial [Candidatus Bathyarchaeota archaeon]